MLYVAKNISLADKASKCVSKIGSRRLLVLKRVNASLVLVIKLDPFIHNHLFHIGLIDYF